MKQSLSIKRLLLLSTAMWLALAAVASPAFSENAVKLRILVITTGEIAEDVGFAYISPVLDAMQVPYDVLNAQTHDLTAAILASSSADKGCKAEDAGCVGNYNGIILTDADLVPDFT
ncbi:MAG: hypothetical protein ABI284_08765, partial [Nitrosospira sp.]